MQMTKQIESSLKRMYVVNTFKGFKKWTANISVTNSKSDTDAL